MGRSQRLNAYERELARLHLLRLEWAYVGASALESNGDKTDCANRCQNHLWMLAVHIENIGIAGRIESMVISRPSEERYGWRILVIAVNSLHLNDPGPLQTALLSDDLPWDWYQLFVEPVPEAFIRELPVLEVPILEQLPAPQSAIELYRWCESQSDADEGTLGAPFETVFHHLNQLGVTNGKELFCKSIGESPDTWQPELPYADWDVCLWSVKFCKKLIHERGEVPHDWDVQCLGIPKAPVNTVGGLVAALKDGFEPLTNASGTNWDQLTKPLTDHARSLLGSVERQAIRLGVAIPETHKAEHRELIQQILDLTKALETAVNVVRSPLTPDVVQTSADNDQSRPRIATDNGSLPATGKPKQRKATANELMLAQVQANVNEVSGFTAKQWSQRIGKSPSTIVATETWKTFCLARDRLKAGRATDRGKNRTRLRREEQFDDAETE